MTKLPDYHQPPVDEIAAAIQFRPMARFGLPEIVKLAAALPEWELVDSLDALPPIVETPPGQMELQQFRLGFGTPPMRAVFQRDGRWRLQVQQDRIAVHETRQKERPRAKAVLPQLRSVVDLISAALGSDSLVARGQAELVELIYVNGLTRARGFEGAAALGHVLRGINDELDPAGRYRPETMRAAWVFVLDELPDEAFVGRLRVEVSPDGDAGTQLQFNSRRYVGADGPYVELERCRADIVEGFTAMTTTSAHKGWDRYQ